MSHEVTWNATFRLLPASLLLAMGSTGCGTALCTMVICCNWCISIRLLFPSTMVSSGVRWFFVCCWFRCFLSYCRHPRFRYFGSVMLCCLGWVLCKLPLTLSLSTNGNLVSFHSGLCPVPLACSETAEFWVRASRISLSCSFILSCMGRPVSPM